MRQPLGGGQLEAAELLRVIRAIGEHLVARRENAGLELPNRAHRGVERGDDLSSHRILHRNYAAGEQLLTIGNRARTRTAARGAGAEHRLVVGSGVVVAGALRLLEARDEEVLVLAISVVDADGEVGEELALGSDEEFVRVRSLHAVVDAASQGDAAGILRIDAAVVADLQQLVALNGVIAVGIEAVEVKRRVGERTGVGHRGALLADIAVIAGAQQRALVGAQAVGQAEARRHAVPLQLLRIAGKVDRWKRCRQVAARVAGARTLQSRGAGKRQRRAENRIGIDCCRRVDGALMVPAQSGHDGEVAHQNGVADVRVVVLLVEGEDHRPDQRRAEASFR